MNALTEHRPVLSAERTREVRRDMAEYALKTALDEADQVLGREKRVRIIRDWEGEHAQEH